MKNDKIKIAYLNMITEANLGDGTAKVQELKNKFLAGKFAEIINDEVVQDIFNEIGMTVSVGASAMQKFENYEALPMAMESAETEMKAYDGTTDAEAPALKTTNLDGDTVELVKSLRTQIFELQKDNAVLHSNNAEIKKMLEQLLEAANKESEDITEKIAKKVCKKLKWQQWKQSAIQGLLLIAACAAMLWAGVMYWNRGADTTPAAARDRYEKVAFEYERKPSKWNAIRKADASAQKAISNATHPGETVKNTLHSTGESLLVKGDEALTQVENFGKDLVNGAANGMQKGVNTVKGWFGKK